jgi:hypothetical protein
MSGRSVILAVEDKLSEAVSTKILEDLGIKIGQRLGLKGKGYLQSKAPSLNQTANFGIHIGLSSKGCALAAQGTQERFSMIGMDVRLCNGPSCLRMFSPWTLIFGALWTFFMCL